MKRGRPLQRKPMRRKPQRAWSIGRRKCIAEGECRCCGSMARDLDPHHIVWKSILVNNDEPNCLPVCRSCHDAIHDRRVDVWDYLTDTERAHAVELIGARQARRLLIPSQAPKRVAIERRAA